MTTTNRNTDLIGSFKNFLRTKFSRFEDALELKLMKEAKRYRAEVRYHEAETELIRLLAFAEDELNEATNELANADRKVQHARTFWCGPQSINWWCKKNNLSFQELKALISTTEFEGRRLGPSPDITQTLEALEYCLQHPETSEYPDWADPEATDDEQTVKRSS